MIEKISRFLNKNLHPSLYDLLKSVYNWSKPVMRPIQNFFFNIKLKRVQANHEKALKIIQKKEKIKVAFFVIHESVWKYDELYRLMEQDKRFDPIIVVCPYIVYGEDNMLREMNQAFNAFNKKGYKTVKTLKENGTWLNVRNEIKPDIVFFTNPYKLTKEEYYITNFQDVITLYVPYGYMTTNRPIMQYNQLLHNLVFRFFLENQFSQQQAIKYSNVKGKNSVVTGYPGLDKIFFYKRNPSPDIWKLKGNRIKKIIWAPHHTIEKDETLFNYSNFLEYADFFIELAQKYEKQISFAFKPHPILRPKLEKLPEWGYERTADYYHKWETLPNCQIIEGDYTDFFLTSDAMIHDSGSFLVEYISTNKPSLYMVRNKSILRGFSPFADLIVNCHYLSFNKNDIENFINKIVIGCDDYLKDKRQQLIKEHLLPPNGKSASQNIFEEINKLINKHL